MGFKLDVVGKRQFYNNKRILVTDSTHERNAIFIYKLHRASCSMELSFHLPNEFIRNLLSHIGQFLPLQIVRNKVSLFESIMKKNPSQYMKIVFYFFSYFTSFPEMMTY